MTDKELVKEEIGELLPSFGNIDFADVNLDAKEILLVYHYIINNYDISLAYLEVFGGTSPAMAKTAGNKILKKPGFQKVLDKLTAEIWKQSLDVLPLKLMRELNTVSNFDVFDYYDEYFAPRPLNTISPEKRKLIQNITVTLDKIGVAHYAYDLPSKGKTASILLELLKIKQVTKTDDGESNDTQSEAKAMRDKIFSQLSLPAAGATP